MPANLSDQTSSTVSRRSSRFSRLHITIMLISSVSFFGGMFTGLWILYFSDIQPVYSLVIFMVLAGIMYVMVCSLSFYHCRKICFDTEQALSNQADVANGASVELNTPADRHPFEVRSLFPPRGRSKGTSPPPPYVLDVPERLNKQGGTFKIRGTPVREMCENEETLQLNEFAFEERSITGHRNEGQLLVRNQEDDLQSKEVTAGRGQRSYTYPNQVPAIIITPTDTDSGRILQSHRMLPNTCQEGNTADVAGQRMAMKTFLRCSPAQNSQRYLMVPSRTSAARSPKRLQRKFEAKATTNPPTSSNRGELIETSQEDLSVTESSTSWEDVTGSESTSPKYSTKITQQEPSNIRKQCNNVHKMNIPVKSTGFKTVTNCSSSTSTDSSLKGLQRNLEDKATTNNLTSTNWYEVIDAPPEDLTVEESSTSQEDLTGSESTISKCSATHSVKRTQQRPSNMRKQYNHVHKMNIPVESTDLKTGGNEKRKVSNPEMKMPLYLVNKMNQLNKSPPTFLDEV